MMARTPSWTTTEQTIQPVRHFPGKRKAQCKSRCSRFLRVPWFVLFCVTYPFVVCGFPFLTEQRGPLLSEFRVEDCREIGKTHEVFCFVNLVHYIYTISTFVSPHQPPVFANCLGYHIKNLKSHVTKMLSLLITHIL